MKLLDYFGNGMLGLAVLLILSGLLGMITQGTLILIEFLPYAKPWPVWAMLVLAALWVAVIGGASKVIAGMVKK